ncbi:MAG TPA: site-2 protease family protein, partial [Pseudomonadales bacterium]|nr:site-2 protease family protein [Pseudomonadales bacterium]
MFKLLFLLLSSLKFGKLLTSGGTMLLSMLMYSFVFGWKYAVGFVLLLFVHELGHYIAARQQGLDVGLPTFIPFVGAWVSLKQLPMNAEQQAYIGIAGPVTGSIAALVCYFMGESQNSGLLLALSYSGFMLNLFNLLPLAALDGGHITAVISPKIWWFGMPLCIALFMQTKSPIFL